MRKPLPSGQEKFFQFEELFFSRTDLRGVIQFGNDVFVQISAYPRDTMIGAPHSLIRHPGMPRSVFRLFWSALKNDRPVGAYVNNLAADGGHYWVYAVAFPVEKGYLSIRLRPSSALFSQVKEIYSRVLEEEARTGMDGGEKSLLELLAGKGFDSYETFMTEALALELGARDRRLLENREIETRERSGRDADPVVARIRALTHQGSDVFHGIFQVVRDFVESKEVFSRKTAEMLQRFQTIRFLSINMTASAEKLGSAATTLAVISGEFQRLAGEIEKHLKMFLDMASGITTDMRNSSFNISALKFQMDMVAFFVQESLRKMSRQGPGENAFQDLEDNRTAFEGLGERSVREVHESLAGLRRKLGGFVSSLDEIETFASGLEVVRQMGSIEAARTADLQRAFENQISELKDFTGFLRESSNQLIRSTRTLNESVVLLENKVPIGGDLLKRIFSQAMG